MDGLWYEYTNKLAYKIMMLGSNLICEGLIAVSTLDGSEHGLWSMCQLDWNILARKIRFVLGPSLSYMLV